MLGEPASRRTGPLGGRVAGCAGGLADRLAGGLFFEQAELTLVPGEVHQFGVLLGRLGRMIAGPDGSSAISELGVASRATAVGPYGRILAGSAHHHVIDRHRTGLARVVVIARGCGGSAEGHGQDGRELSLLKRKLKVASTDRNILK